MGLEVDFKSGATGSARRFGWDTVAAVASAVGAIASAIVAIFALSYAHVQETTAEKQLQATYPGFPR